VQDCHIPRFPLHRPFIYKDGPGLTIVTGRFYIRPYCKEFCPKRNTRIEPLERSKTSEDRFHDEAKQMQYNQAESPKSYQQVFEAPDFLSA